MQNLAILSMHTSPLTQPGSGDGGGMNVYVRQLAAALARQGVRCDIFTRAEDARRPPVVGVEPGLRVHHVPAGPLGPMAKEDLPGVVAAWTDGVGERLDGLAAGGRPIDAIHANYWLSGVAGHTLKHRLDVPLLSTFHTLDRVKQLGGPDMAPPNLDRQQAEADIIGCSDVVLASCSVEAEQLTSLYDADPERIEIIPPGVNHAFFSPGERTQARRAVGLSGKGPVVLFVGRIQPLKGLTVAVRALAAIVEGETGAGSWTRQARLVVVGGPSGPDGEAELLAARSLIECHRLGDRVIMVPPQPHEILSTYYRAADICVVPSRSESFGLVALEAGACGIPVVAAAVGGLTTLVDHGHTGLLVDGTAPTGFAQALSRTLADPAVAANAGRAAARRARSYSWSAAAARLIDRCESLTERELVACR
ncbi:MAG: glycosyltransferase [Actinomycetota bacterium]|nr:glycosyltransferase [Actinomycetota bacterium]